MSHYGLDNEEIVQNTLEELCVAQYAENYCSSCSSGSGCCADYPLSVTGNGDDCEAAMIEYQEVEDDKEYLESDRNLRRATLTIDLSNDDNLSDAEILKRLLSPLASPLSDEPLEVILEIVDEEDDDDDSEIPTPKTFQSLREKLRKISSCKPSRNSRSNSLYWKRQLRKIKQDLDSSVNDIDDNTRYSSLEMCPSYHKANSLINEIEKCFMETANLVEKTLESAKIQGMLESDIADRESDENLDTRQFTSTVEEALHIFDSMLNDRSIRKIDCNGVNNDNDNTNLTLSNSFSNPNLYKNEQYNYQNGGINDNDTWYQQTMNLRRGASFERDIDELFRECYELASVEPSTSLASCLRNLEILCVQLNKVKENILMEIKNDFRGGLIIDNADYYGSQASSLDSQECLSIINELIDRKLKEKLKRTKFISDPPLMGLEGRTHKKIAEDLHLKYEKENDTNFSTENDISFSYLRDNKNKMYNALSSMDATYGHVEQTEFISENTSDMSTTTNTMDSSRCFSSSSRTGNYGNGDTSKHSVSSEDGESIAMSYEETLALYEDNQELQKSLLSILHSLNDIHDNFLNRRRMEMALSQQNSDFIQNHLKSEIFATNQRNDFSNVDTFHDPPKISTSISTQFKQDFSIKLDDYEPIERINRVSDELKNMWLYATKDLELKSRKPTRTVSFNRGLKRYKQFSDYYEESFSDDYDYSDSLYGKSLSLPNLSATHAETYNCYSPNSSLHSPTSPRLSKISETQSQNFFVDNFVKHMKDENSKSYEVTLNFLHRIMETSKIIDEDSAQASRNQNYNAFQRTY